MDSQSRGRDIYLAMPPSGIAITPEFCSKNPYAIALGIPANVPMLGTSR